MIFSCGISQEISLFYCESYCAGGLTRINSHARTKSTEQRKLPLFGAYGKHKGRGNYVTMLWQKEFAKLVVTSTKKGRCVPSALAPNRSSKNRPEFYSGRFFDERKH